MNMNTAIYEFFYIFQCKKLSNRSELDIKKH